MVRQHSSGMLPVVHARLTTLTKIALLVSKFIECRTRSKPRKYYLKDEDFHAEAGP